jgi:hypothetical protein
MDAMRFFRELPILSVFSFLSVSALLLHTCIVIAETKQPWDLLAARFRAPSVPLLRTSFSDPRNTNKGPA